MESSFAFYFIYVCILSTNNIVAHVAGILESIGRVGFRVWFFVVKYIIFNPFILVRPEQRQAHLFAASNDSLVTINLFDKGYRQRITCLRKKKHIRRARFVLFFSFTESKIIQQIRRWKSGPERMDKQHQTRIYIHQGHVAHDF